jgi:hypothetical protein
MNKFDDEEKHNHNDNFNRKCFKVESILARKKVGHELFYLVKWKNYGYDDSTWEPRKNLLSLGEYLSDFDKYFSENGSTFLNKKTRMSSPLLEKEINVVKYNPKNKKDFDTRDKKIEKQVVENLRIGKRTSHKEIIEISSPEEKVILKSGNIEKNEPESILDFKCNSDGGFDFLVSWKRIHKEKVEPSYVTEKKLKNKNEVLINNYLRECFTQFAKIRTLTSQPIK